MSDWPSPPRRPRQCPIASSNWLRLDGKREGHYVTLSAMNEIVPKPAARTTTTVGSTIVIPTAIAGAGDHAARRFLEFFAATIRNKNTRMAYYRAACSFFAWLEQRSVTEL